MVWHSDCCLSRYIDAPLSVFADEGANPLYHYHVLLRLRLCCRLCCRSFSWSRTFVSLVFIIAFIVTFALILLMLTEALLVMVACGLTLAAGLLAQRSSWAGVH